MHGSRSRWGPDDPISSLYLQLQHAQNPLNLDAQEKASDLAAAVAHELNRQALAFRCHRHLYCEFGARGVGETAFAVAAIAASFSKATSSPW